VRLALRCLAIASCPFDNQLALFLGRVVAKGCEARFVVIGHQALGLVDENVMVIKPLRLVETVESTTDGEYLMRVLPDHAGASVAAPVEMGSERPSRERKRRTGRRTLSSHNSTRSMASVRRFRASSSRCVFASLPRISLTDASIDRCSRGHRLVSGCAHPDPEQVDDVLPHLQCSV
jgi:hypothetical protein